MAQLCPYLPREILFLVFADLPISDIKHLRLVCRDYHDSASSFLLQSLVIASDNGNLSFWKSICGNDLFRKGISAVIYDVRLIHQLRRNSHYGHQNTKLDCDPHPADRCAVTQYYDVYRALCAGMSRLPMLKHVTITDRPWSSSTLRRHDAPWNSSRMKGRNLDLANEGRVSFFVLLRSLSELAILPEVFEMSLQNCIPGSTTRFRADPLPSSQDVSLLTLFTRCLEMARLVFTHLHQLSISTRGPDLERDDYMASLFVENLSAFIQTAGPRLESLQVVVQDMPLPPLVPSPTPLFSTILFDGSPLRWIHLRTLTLKGVDINGFEFIAFLSRQTSLREVELSHVYLTRKSLDWPGILEDLRITLGAQPYGQQRTQCRRNTTTGPMECIALNLQRVFEPWDESLEWPITMPSVELADYFAGKEDNPLLTCYDQFLGS